jgi:MFS family permease
MYLSSSRTAAPARHGAGRVPATVFGLGLVSLITDISAEMVTAVLPLYLMYGVGVGFMFLGTIEALYTGATAVLRLAGGYVADRFRQPKTVAAAGYGLSAVAKLGLPLAGGSLPAIGTVLAVDRAGKGIRTGPRDAMITLATPADSLGKAFGVHRAMDTTGALLGPIVATALVSMAAGYDTVFTTSFTLGIVGVLILVFFVPAPSSAAPGLVTPVVSASQHARRRPSHVEGAMPVAWGEAETTGSQRPSPSSRSEDNQNCQTPSVELKSGGPPVRVALAMALGQPRVLKVCLAAGLLGLVTVGDMILYVLVQQQASLPTAVLPLLPLGTAVTFLLAAAPVGLLADRVGRWRVFLAGHGLLLVAYLLVGFAPDFALLALGLHGLFYAATDGVLMAYVGPLIPVAIRSTGISAVQTVQTLARAGGALVVGLALQFSSPQVAFVGLAVLLGVAILAGVRLGRQA